MRISQLADETHETPRTLRFYETAGLLPPPPRTPGGYRNYPPSAINQIQFIRSLQQAGLALTEIAAIVHLRDDPEPPSPGETALVTSTTSRVEHHLATLIRMRASLAELAGENPEADDS